MKEQNRLSNLTVATYLRLEKIQLAHMQLEDSVIIPAIQLSLNEHDWVILLENLDIGVDPLFGPYVWHDYKTLYNNLMAHKAKLYTAS